MARLAIKGHSTRGKEVIEILEMLGGENKLEHYATLESCIYFIDVDNTIRLLHINQLLPEQYIVYSIEEFKEKYPYKVGDTVTLDGWPCTIVGVCWDTTDDIIYYVKGVDFSRGVYVNDLRPCKEEKTVPPCMDCDITTSNEKAEIAKFTISDAPQSINLTQTNVNEIEVVLGDYEIVLKDGKTYFVKKKPKHPTCYVECCEILEHNPFVNNVSGYASDSIGALQTLITCRDAYWKIAGEEMGLGKNWEPDCKSENETYFTIAYDGINIKLYNNTDIYAKFAFPTAEMRDKFYENFKDLIEQCKKLL